MLAADGEDDAEFERLLCLGASRLDSAPGGDEAVLLADPDGSMFRVLTHR
ncbi:VOC family protein [Streptomyces sp. NPDC021608]